MQWVTENPWPIMILLLTAAVVSALMIERKGRLIAAILAAMAAGVWLIEQSTVTTAEEVQAAAEDMLNGFITRDLNVVQGRISETKPELRETAQKGMDLVKLGESFHIKDVEVAVSDNGTQATMKLRANGPVTLEREGYVQNAATRWNTTWVLESGQWKLSAYERLSVINNKPIGAFDAAQ
ncbi:MAG: hypothetical protein JNL58_01360 [Planctomyces sp.]|nr:hypothetical protein [Planctomyces sp.]